MVDSWQREVVLGAVLIERREVDAHAEHLCVLLGYEHRVGHPRSFLDLPDEFCFEESIDFLAYRLALWLRKSPHRLLDESCIRKHLQGMLGKFSGYAWHVGRTPRENFPALTEELDERAFLCLG